MPHSLYERLGGQEAVKAVVALLYDKILSDPILIPYFTHIDIEKLRASQAAFVTMAFGGPTHYTGASLRTAHAKLVEKGLSDPHFDAVKGHLHSAMETLGVSPKLIEEALGVVETTRTDVLGR